MRNILFLISDLNKNFSLEISVWVIRFGLVIGSEYFGEFWKLLSVFEFGCVR